MVSGRPRRSAAPDSYQIAFPELTSESEGDESESGEHEGGDQANGQNGEASTGDINTADGLEVGEAPIGNDGSGEPKIKQKKKKRKQPSPSPDDGIDSASGSEFALEVVKDKDGTLIEVQDDDEDDDVIDEDLVEESDSGDSAAGEKDLDGISIANSDIDEPPSPGATGKQGIKYGKARYNFAGHTSEDGKPHASSSNSAPIRIVGRQALAPTGTASTASNATGEMRRGAARKKVPGMYVNGPKKLGLYELNYGPAFWAPPLLLSAPFDDPAHCPAENSEASGARGLKTLQSFTPSQRLFVMRRAAYVPFGPHPAVCLDFGWHKGKYKESEEGTLQRSERWGGWYDEVASDALAFGFVNDINEILPHLPKNIYPALPANVNLDCKSEDQADKVEENEDENWDQSITMDGTTGQTDSNAADVFKSGANLLQGRVQQAQSRRRDPQKAQQDDEGVFRILCGSVIDENGQQIPQQCAELERFTSLRLDTYLQEKPGFMLNAGGPVWGLDWCPQADNVCPAMSTVSEQPSIAYRRQARAAPSQSMIQIWSMDTSVASDFASSTAADAKGRGMRLDLALLVEQEIMQLQWCPRGGAQEPELNDTMANQAAPAPNNLQRLGLLAALTIDRAIEIYDIPRPESSRQACLAAADDLVFLRRDSPLLSLDIGNVPVSCFDWASHERIVVGCSTGDVAVFDIGDALRNGLSKVGPTSFFPVHEGSVTWITSIRVPRLDSEGQPKVDEEASRIATTSLDGSCKLVDLRDVADVFDFGHERAVRFALAYQPITDTVHFADAEMGHRYLILKGREFGTTTRVISQLGPVNNLATSDFHSFYSAVSADGSCAIANTMRRAKRGGHAVHYLNRQYRMDFDRKSGTYRMLDNIMPDSRYSTEAKASKNKAKGKKGESDYTEDIDALASYAWSPEVSINRSAWSRSLRRAHVLASGMACGLVRIDMTGSHWTTEASGTTRSEGFEGGDDSD